MYVLNCTGDHYCYFTTDACQHWTDSSDYYSEYLIIHFDYRVKYSRFLLAVEALFHTNFMIPNKVLDITKIQMLIFNICKYRMNNGSNNQIFISIILIICPRLEFVGSNAIPDVIKAQASDPLIF